MSRKEWAAKPRGVARIACNLFALLFFLSFLPISAQLAEKSAPVHNFDGSFVKEWLVLGPFPSKDVESDFLADVGGEANVRPKEGDAVTRSDGTRLSWTRFRSQRDRVNLEEHFGIQPWSVAYVYCELNSDQAGETGLRAVSHWSQSLWLNGAKIREIPVHLDHPGTDLLPAFPARLNAGNNACLLKLGRRWEPWHFTFQPLPPSRATAELRVTDPAGRSVAQALIEFYERGELAGRLTADGSGNTEACLFPSAGAYDLHVTSAGLDAWVFDLKLPPGEHREYEVVLSNAVSISGKVLAMDGSPQNAIVVQAVRVSDAPADSGGATLRGALIHIADQTNFRQANHEFSN